MVGLRRGSLCRNGGRVGWTSWRFSCYDEHTSRPRNSQQGHINATKLKHAP
jgi:hypothetical protein